MATPCIVTTMNPHFRIQVLFDNEPGTPTKEFNIYAYDFAEPTFNALVAHVLCMTSFGDSLDDYNFTFKYQLQEIHTSRWVNFEDTEGLGYAIQSNREKGYVFISVSIVKKVASIMEAPSPVRNRPTQGSNAKPKIARKSRTTKTKAPTRHHKFPLDQKILSSLKELYDLGITLPLRQQVALFSDYLNAKISTFANDLSKLKAQKLIEYSDSKTICLTQAGIANAAGQVDQLKSNEDFHERIFKLLKGLEISVFDILINDGYVQTRVEVAAKDGNAGREKTSTFLNALSKLKTLGLLSYVEDEHEAKLLQLTHLAFPLERPTASGSSAGANRK